MNVLLVGYMFGRGGIQTHTHFLAEGLIQRGHKVDVISPPATSGDRRPLRRGGSYRLNVYNGLADIANGFAYSRLEIPDVAIVCGTGWKAMAGLLALSTPTRKVFFEVMSGKRNGHIDPRMLIHCGFDAVVGQTSQVEERFCREFGWNGLHLAIPALPEALEKVCEIPLRRVSRHDGMLRLVYFGRLTHHKGLSFLLENWETLAIYNATLDIFGNGPEEAKLATIIKARGLGSKVRLMGTYPEGANYVELMQSYDIKLLPTWGDEGAPLVLLEAMACGLPFVANGVGGISDYRNDDCCITGGDLSDFFRAFDELVNKLKLGWVNPQRLQDHYRQHFSFDALVNRWETFLVELAGTSPEQKQLR